MTIRTTLKDTLRTIMITKPERGMMNMNGHELRKLLPETKLEIDKAEQLIRLGYPTIKPVIADMLNWIYSPNDPVCWYFAPYLTAISHHVIDELAQFLDGTHHADNPTHQDYQLYAQNKCSVMTLVLDSIPVSTLAQLQSPLYRLAYHSSLMDHRAGCHQVARRLLDKLAA